MVSRANGPALKRYHACAKRNLCGVKYKKPTGRFARKTSQAPKKSTPRRSSRARKAPNRLGSS